jgi:excisionase family DNA binding protein
MVRRSPHQGFSQQLSRSVTEHEFFYRRRTAHWSVLRSKVQQSGPGGVVASTEQKNRRGHVRSGAGCALHRHLYVACPSSSSKGRRELLSTREAAARMGVCERTLRRYIDARRLASRRLPGGHYRIAPEAIAEFWAAQERRVAARHRQRTGQAERPAPTAQRRRRAGRLSASTTREFDLSDANLAALRERHLASAASRRVGGAR